MYIYKFVLYLFYIRPLKCYVLPTVHVYMKVKINLFYYVLSIYFK